MNVDNRQSTEPASLSRPVSHMIYHLKANFKSLIVCAFKRWFSFYLLSLLVLSYEIFQICKIQRKYWTNSLEFEMDIKKITKRVRENTWNLSSFRLCVITHDMMFWLLCALRLLYVCFFFIHHCLRWRKYIKTRERKKNPLQQWWHQASGCFVCISTTFACKYAKKSKWQWRLFWSIIFANVYNPCVFTVHTVPKKSSKENFAQHQLLNIINVNIQNKLMQRLTLSKSKSKQ